MVLSLANTIRNVEVLALKDDGKFVLEPRSLLQIAGDVRNIKGNWPRVLNGRLFAIRSSKELPTIGDHSFVRYLDTIDGLFAWIRENHVLVWQSSQNPQGLEFIASPVTKGEFLVHMRESCKWNYDTAERYPHVPDVEKAYYLPCKLPTSTGEGIKSFMALLNPATELDRELILLGAIAPCWGGPPGARPAFLFRSKYKYGAGKSKTAELICDIWGSALQFNEKNSWADITKGIANDKTSDRRCILIDNIQDEFYSSGLASLITSRHLSGHIFRVGPLQKENRMCVYLTANTPKLSEDLIQRSIIIDIGEPINDDGWIDRANDWQKNERSLFIADCVALLKGEDKCKIPSTISRRWGSFAKDVMAKRELGVETAELILEKREELMLEGRKPQAIKIHPTDMKQLQKP